MAPADVPDEALEGASLVHLTGITMALGDGPRALVLDVARRARAAGAIVTFDPNYRPALWDGPRRPRPRWSPVLEHVDWYLCGAEEAEELLGAGEPTACSTPAARGVGGAVVRDGERGALVAAGGEVQAVRRAARGGRGRDRRRRRVRGRLRLRAAAGLGRRRRAVDAAHASRRALRGTGDWETLPRRRGARAASRDFAGA